MHQPLNVAVINIFCFMSRISREESNYLSKSNKKELCNLSNEFKPASIIKNKYPEYYDKLEDKAIKIIQAYSMKTKLNR